MIHSDNIDAFFTSVRQHCYTASDLSLYSSVILAPFSSVSHNHITAS